MSTCTKTHHYTKY